MGGVFNVVNLHVYHYAGNNPVVLSDPDGNADVGRWFARNWTKLIGAGISISEIATGAGIATGTGVTVIGGALGTGMIIHGAANLSVVVAKITITTIVANIRNDDYADYLDQAIPDTALGLAFGAIGLMVDLIMGGGNTAEKAGAVGDLADIAVGLGLSWSASISLTNSLQKFRTSSGRLISKTDLMKLNEYLLNTDKISAAKIVQGLIETFNNANSFIDNGNQILER
jgi:hypothetical protein